MSSRILVFYGSYRSDRMGIRLAQYVVERLRRRGDDVELIDARNIRKSRRRKPLNGSPARSETPTDSCSSPASTIGASSPD